MITLKRTPYLVTAFMAAFYSLPMARAQEAGEGSSLFFDVVYWGVWMDRPLKFRTGKEIKAIPLQGGVSSAFVYKGPSPLILYRQEATDPKTQETTPIPILSVPFSNGLKRAILIISPTPTDEKALKANLVPMTNDVFPGGTALFMNGTSKKLKSRLSDDVFELEPKQKILKSLPSQKTPVPLIIASDWKGKMAVMHTDSFSSKEGERRLIFFYTPNNSEGVNTFVTVIPPDKERFGPEGIPRESSSVDPNFEPGENPTGSIPFSEPP